MSFTTEMPHQAVIEDIARLCHEVNRVYCETLDDHSQTSWDLAHRYQKESAINGVIFHLNNPNASASHAHEEWLKEKEKDGWTWGPIKNESRKEHPCMVEYDKLPKEQQLKDYLFKAVVHAYGECYKYIDPSYKP